MSSGRRPSELRERLLAAAQQETSWLVRMVDDSQRRLSTSELVDAYNEQRIHPETYVWTEGMQRWMRLQPVDSLVDALRAAAEPSTAERHHGSGESTSEDSAIFSLATLVNDGPKASSAVEVSTTGDSGLIDLRALAADQLHDMQEPDTPPALDGDIFLTPAAPAPPPPSAAPPARDGGRGIVLALLVAVSLLSAALVFLLVRGAGSAAVGTTTPTAPATSHATTPSPLTSVSATPEPPTPAMSSSAEPMGTASASALPQPSVPRATATVRATRQPTVTAPPPAPADNGCPCKPDDLLCQMRCAAGR